MWKISGNEATFQVDFKVDDEFIIPDASSVVVKVRDTLANALIYSNEPLVSVPTSSIQVVLPASINTLEAGALFEARYVQVDFKFQGKQHTKNFSYYISKFVPLTKNAQDARVLLGVDHRELPDEEIDLMSAYFSLRNTYGEAFENALKTIGSVSVAANKAVLITAILDIFSSLQNRILLRERSDTSEFQRNKINLSTLKADLESSLTGALASITGISVTAYNKTNFVVSAPTDPLTGV